MDKPKDPSLPRDRAAQQVREAHTTLSALRDRLQHSEYREELDEAITKLEVALGVLGVKTGGLL